ncbi:hypothetical protein N7452_009436 [Penicillium brevicompactum]|uniref:Leptomycin B resistance protein pmd1 n=1 Tax=Penicillium brevicompactum TaxID=5074 RepID=A0A9W9UA84_PENBR|nr:hypothetical protein N7452_009436 [Penicillium brevicompactum]
MGFQAAATTQTSPQGDEGSTDRLSDQSDRPVLPEPEHTATFKDYLRIFTYATHRDVLTLSAGTLAAIGSGVTQPLMFILFGNFVQEFTGVVKDGETNIPKTGKTLNQLCLFIFALFIARFGLASIQKFAFRMIAIRLSAAILLHYICHLFDQSVHVLDSLPSGHAATSIASESFSGIRMVMACGAQQQVVEKYGVIVEKAKKQARATNPITSLQFTLTFFGVFGIIALTYWYGTLIFIKGRLENLAIITVVLLNLTTIFFSLDRVSSPMQAMSKASIAVCEFFSVIDAPAPQKGTLRAPEISATDDIIFKNVTFAYPGRPDVKILDDLDLQVKAGKINAIVGPSGSGKSTIVGLIERWYTLKQQYIINSPAKATPGDNPLDTADIVSNNKAGQHGSPVDLQGIVTTCGRSLDEIDVKWWRSKIGLVQQEPFLFNDTIYHNVARGLVGSVWEAESEQRKRELVSEACKEAFADEFVDKLPLGYDTTVGDGGARLSGGQRQRLAIARSIVKKPDILILDEATSAIDVRGERVVQAALDKASQHRTTIVIAHRLSTIKNADHIIVLNKGKVFESGNHKSLVSMEGGLYAGLVTAQAISLGDSAPGFGNPFVKHDESITAMEEPEEFQTSSDSLQDNKLEKSTQKRSFPFGGFAQLFLESRNYWHVMIFSIVVSALAGAAQPLHAWLFSRTVSLFKWQDNHSKLMQEVDFMSIMWTVFAASAAIAYYITFLSSGYIASFIRAKYQMQYFQSLIYQRAAYFTEDDHSHGTLVARVRDDPHRLEEMMGVDLAQVGIAVFNIFGGIVLALVYSWKLALVSLCAVGPVCVLSSYIRFRYEVKFENMNDEVFAESSQFASEAIGAFRTVVSLTLEDSISARWVSIILGLSDSLNLGCQAFIFYYGGRLLTSGEIDTMDFFVCLMAIMNAAEGFGKSLSLGPNAVQATNASDRILAARESTLVESTDSDDIPIQAGGIKIEIRDLCLRYPGQETPALEGLNMTIEKGQDAALVGASGSGKSSIVSLLERFQEPESGQILFNGKDVMDVNIHALRKHLSLVAQEPTLFQGTARENILLGMDADTITNDELVAACRDASIHDFIASLPESYETDIGSRGIALSGGQKQRIAIASALIRKPRILLLDEATSSLDSESERLVQIAFERAANGRTVIVVAHRLSKVQNADVIFVMGEGGKLLEKGSHSDLLRKRGVYFQMCQIQAFDQ